MKLISACLLGVKCAWSGDERYQDERALALARQESLVPVCPEQLGGLSTPRPPQEIQGGGGEGVLDGRCRVLNKEGVDVTGEFISGARETLKIAQQLNIREFIGKARSPSCGCGQVYDGSFSEKLVSGDGVTTALLKRNGIKVSNLEDLMKLG
ncbi:MAG: DUF523 domain-containing protein [Dehalococcoidia bacterium]|nr:MAG: DUF523 domain-containing protein [Dehalococcoidia bacterium]